MISTRQAKKDNLDLIYKLKTDIRLLREENREIIHQFLTRDCSKDFRNIRNEIDNLVFLKPGQKEQLYKLVEGCELTSAEYDNRVFKLKRYHALLLLKRTLIHTQIKMICIICNLLKEEYNGD